jgi:hypothetical protein
MNDLYFSVVTFQNAVIQTLSKLATILLQLMTHIILFSEVVIHSKNVHEVCSRKNKEILKLH